MDIYEQALNCRNAMIQRASWIMRDRSDAELIADEVLADFATKKMTFNAKEGNLKVYLRTAARNRAIDHQRKMSRAKRTTSKKLAHCVSCPRNIADGHCLVLGPYYRGMVRDCQKFGYKYGSITKPGHYGFYLTTSLDKGISDQGPYTDEMLSHSRSEISDENYNQTPHTIGDTVEGIAFSEDKTEGGHRFVRPLNKQQLLIVVLSDLKWASKGMIDRPLSSKEIAEVYNNTIYAPPLEKPPREMNDGNVRYIQHSLRTGN
jgi:hypothetical protein